MKRRPSQDVWEVFHILTNAAENFVNRSPRSKRLETERQALLDAIRRAQLVLSVNRLAPPSSASDPSVPSLANFRARRKESKESSRTRRNRRE
jgi:hypothetical protein